MRAGIEEVVGWKEGKNWLPEAVTRVDEWNTALIPSV